MLDTLRVLMLDIFKIFKVDCMSPASIHLQVNTKAICRNFNFWNIAEESLLQFAVTMLAPPVLLAIFQLLKPLASTECQRIWMQRRPSRRNKRSGHHSRRGRSV